MRDRLVAVGAQQASVADQKDTYFAATEGLLKIRAGRERPVAGPERVVGDLVAYRRHPGGGVRACSYVVVPLVDAAAVRNALATVLRVSAVVRKRREIWWSGGSRVHLDDVSDLGTFVEVETALTDHADPGPAHRALLLDLGLRPEDGVSGSYADLLARAS